ncbi:MAG TPA: hypothetical protein VI365_24345 [Trebonia sp.]
MDRRAFSLVAVTSAVAVCLGLAGCMAAGPSGQAPQLPGLSALVPSGADIYHAGIAAVSCTSPSDCVAGGSLAYTKISGNRASPRDSSPS